MSKLALIFIVLSNSFVFAQQDLAVSPKASTLKIVSSKARFKASLIFNEAIDDFESQKYDSAYTTFMKASEQKGVSIEEKGLALYNAALSLERNKKYKKAIELYTIICANDSYK